MDLALEAGIGFNPHVSPRPAACQPFDFIQKKLLPAQTCLHRRDLGKARLSFHPWSSNTSLPRHFRTKRSHRGYKKGFFRQQRALTPKDALRKKKSFCLIYSMFEDRVESCFLLVGAKCTVAIGPSGSLFEDSAAFSVFRRLPGHILLSTKHQGCSCLLITPMLTEHKEIHHSLAGATRPKTPTHGFGVPACHTVMKKKSFTLDRR